MIIMVLFLQGSTREYDVLLNELENPELEVCNPFWVVTFTRSLIWKKQYLPMYICSLTRIAKFSLFNLDIKLIWHRSSCTFLSKLWGVPGSRHRVWQLWMLKCNCLCCKRFILPHREQWHHYVSFIILTSEFADNGRCVVCCITPSLHQSKEFFLFD